MMPILFTVQVDLFSSFSVKFNTEHELVIISVSRRTQVKRITGFQTMPAERLEPRTASSVQYKAVYTS